MIRLTMNSSCAIQGLWIWILVLVMFVLTSCGVRLEPAQLRTSGEHVGEILGEHTVGQTFVTQHDGLQAVDVLLATFARDNTQPVIFRLRTDLQSDMDIRTVAVPAAEIKDNAYHRFSFQPVPDSDHQRFYFFIESPNSQPGDAITAWIGPGDAYREGSLYVAGQAREGQLAFSLGYSNSHVFLGLMRDLLTGLPVVVVAATLFILPGLTLLLWLAPVWQWDQLLTLMAAAGLSAALFPLLLLFSRPVGVRWDSGLTWSFLLVCLGLLAWRLRRVVAGGLVQTTWSGWRGLVSRLGPETWLFLAVAALTIGVRWLVVRPLTVPLWGDSHQHTYIAQLMIEHGGLFDSWEPYSPYTSLTVHFGFHAAVAFFHWATGVEVLKAVILVGQVFNGLAVLTLYPLAVRISGNRWAGIAAIVVAGLLMPIPMEYVNWGRYPQLAGQAILPVALWLLWRMADHQGRGGWRLAVLAAIANAGMTLTYYRMPYFYAAFLPGWLLLYCLARWRRDRGRCLTLLKRVTLLGAVMLIMILPWVSNIAGGPLATAVDSGVRNAPSLTRILDEYRAWRNIGQYVSAILLWSSLAGFVWSLVRRRRGGALIGLWTLGLAALLATRLIRLPGANLLTSYAIHIALYMPVGLILGWMVGEVAGIVTRRWKVWGSIVLGLPLLALATIGAKMQMAAVDPAFVLVNRADEAAMDWIQRNTPPEATFLVNGFPIYGGHSAVGSDAGWWIPLLAGRKNTMPPQYALFNEAEAIPGYGRAVVQLVLDLDNTPPTTANGLELLCRFGVTHIYIGQGQGKVAREELTPYLVPAELSASAYFELVYRQDRVWIFALKEGVCS